MGAIHYYFIDAYNYTFLLSIHLMTNVLIIICKEILNNSCKHYVITFLIKKNIAPNTYLKLHSIEVQYFIQSTKHHRISTFLLCYGISDNNRPHVSDA